MSPADIAAAIVKGQAKHEEREFSRRVLEAYSKHLGRQVTIEEVQHGASQDALPEQGVNIFYWHDQPVLHTRRVYPPLEFDSMVYRAPYTEFHYLG